MIFNICAPSSAFSLIIVALCYPIWRNTYQIKAEYPSYEMVSTKPSSLHFFGNLHNLLSNIDHRLFKFAVVILDIIMEGTAFQIFFFRP